MVTIENMIDDNMKNVALPAVVMQVVSMLTSDDVDCKKLSEVIKNDQVLTMAVMRRANSVAYSGHHNEFNLEQSIVRLGTRNIMHFILEYKLMDKICAQNKAFGLDRMSAWRNAVGGAVAASRIAKVHAPDMADVCYICALLRDIGKTLLDLQYGSRYMCNTESDHCLLAYPQSEVNAYGYNHAMVGCSIAEFWKMPDIVCKSIMYHHNPPANPSEHNIVFDIVHAADVITLWSGVAIGYDGMQYSIADHVVEELKLSRTYIENTIGDIVCEVQNIERTLEPLPEEAVNDM